MKQVNRFSMLFLLCFFAVNLFSEDLRFSLGAGLAYFKTDQSLSVTDSEGAFSSTQDINNLGGFEVWADSTFLELRAGYYTTFLPSLRENKGEGASTTLVGFQEVASSSTVLTALAFGKYPFTFGIFSLAPELGFLYSKNILYVRPAPPSNTIDLWTDLPSERDDLFLLYGFELDCKITQSVLIKFSFALGHNVNTHRQAAKSYADTYELTLTHGGNILYTTLGIGYVL